MRQIQNGLKGAAEAHGGDLVDHQCQNDGDREAHRQTVQAQPKSIADGGLALIGVEKALKIFEQRLRPRAAQNAQRVFVVLERDHHAVHGLVGKQDQQHQRGQQQQIQSPVPADPLPRSRAIHTASLPFRFLIYRLTCFYSITEKFPCQDTFFVFMQRIVKSVENIRFLFLFFFWS